MTAEAKAADFTVQNHGSIFLLCPQTEAATEWARKHIGGENGFQPYWPGAVVVEHRYITDIVEGIKSDGLQVEAA
jgi:hypothetical protein